jgi:hypothetical protein
VTPAVIARSAATKQSSRARSAPPEKRLNLPLLPRFFVCALARALDCFASLAMTACFCFDNQALTRFVDRH